MYYCLTDLRSGVRRKSDQYQTQRIQDDELDQYINEGIDQAQSIIFPLNEGHFRRYAYTDLVSGTNEYRLPEDSKALVGVDVSTDNGLNYYALKERDADRRNVSSDTGDSRSFFFIGDSIMLLGSNTANSTNGLRWLHEWEHWDLDDSTSYQATVSAATRASNIISVTTTAAHNVVNGQLITLGSMVDSTFDGTFRVLSVPTTSTLTCSQTGFADDAGAGNTGTLYRRYGMDLPGGKTVKRFVEAWACRMVLMRDEKDSSKVDEELAYLSSRIKMNLNYRNRGRIKKIRLRGTYRDSIVDTYSRRIV